VILHASRDQTPRPEHLDQEAAWAHGRWPDALANVRFVFLLPELLERFDGVTAPVLAFDDGIRYRCLPFLVEQGSYSDAWLGIVIEKDALVRGTRRREGFTVHLGEDLVTSHGYVFRRQLADGTWVDEGGGGRSGEEYWGSLSEVSKRVIRYAGRTATLEARCRTSGPEWVCADKPGAKCPRCEAVDVTVTAKKYDSETVQLGRILERPKGCDNWCMPTHSDIDRLQAIPGARVVAPGERYPAIYQSQTDCLAERDL